MKNFKNKISLCLAVIMVINLLVPFAPPMSVSVFANQANDGRLRVSVNSTLAPSAAAPIYRPRTPAPGGSVMLYWDVVAAEILGQPFMDVLRFFDEDGRRHELSVTYLRGATGESGLMVSHDIYIQRFDADGKIVGYIHINDPLRTFTTFMVYSHIPSQANFIPVVEHIVDNYRYRDLRDSEVGTHLNRVNDRLRFVDVNPSLPFTPVRPNFLTFTGDDANLNANSSILVPNPNHDPADPGQPLFIEERTSFFSPSHYARLSPHFNIAERRGYSFQMVGKTFHFRWTNNQFYFFVEDILGQDSIHEFVLERYVGRANIDAYVLGTGIGAGIPAGNRLVSANVVPPHAATPPNTVYVFKGIDTSSPALNAIPFATNAAVPELPHTRRDRIFAAANANIDAPPPYNPSNPRFDTSQLDINPPNPGVPAKPAAPEQGLDIRFNLPRLFDEASGGFTGSLYTHAGLLSQLGISLSANVAGTITPVDFYVSFPLLNLPLYGPYTYAPNLWGSVFFDVPYRDGDDIRLRNVSRLRRPGQVAPTPGEPEEADRVRIMVEGLRPSVAYEAVYLRLNPRGTATNILNADRRALVPEENPFYTFIAFRFDTLLGRPVIVAEPFNRGLAQWIGYPSTVRYYELVVADDIPFPGRQPVRVTTAAEVRFSLPDVLPYGQFFISRTRINPLLPGDTPVALRSQEVFWRRVREPNIDLPENFHMVVQPGYHRPMAGEDNAGHLEFTARWNIGSLGDILELLGVVNGVVTEPDLRMEVSYIIGHSTAAGTLPLDAGEDIAHRGLLRINMEIRPCVVRPGELQVRYLYTSDFIRPLRFLGTDALPATPHPIVNRASDSLYTGAEEGWMPLEVVLFRGDRVAVASVDILTNTVRRFTYPPPLENLRRAFHFPGIYFLNVMLERWRHVGDADSRGGPSPWSLFAYIVVDDMGQLTPPPPSNLGVAAGPRPPAPVWPYLDVSFEIPSTAILTYLQTLYPMETQITTNIYIGQFEEAILDNFFPYPAPPAPREREPLAPEYRVDPGLVYDIPFDEIVMGFEKGRTELDLTRAQAHLRGEGAGTGVVRISGIPLIRSQSVTPAALGTVINYGVAGGGYSQAESFTETYSVLNSGRNFPIHLRLTGVEENTAYFLFSDLEIEKWVEASNGIGWVLRQQIVQNNVVINPNPAVSDLSGIVSDTTVGLPQEPGPGEVSPPAPENLHIYDLGQMEATLRWTPFVLTPAEQEDGIQIEWEIIRIQDGKKLTDAQLNDRNPKFRQFFDSLIGSPQRKGWLTDGIALTILPGEQLHSEPNKNDYYNYRPHIVELRDMTVLPNNLYFYYVRTVRIEQAWDDRLRDYVLIRAVSTWVELPVTTAPIEPPNNLRQEDPVDRAGFDGETMVLVSWEHPIMRQMLKSIGEMYMFQYQVREFDDQWGGEVNTVPVARMTEANLDEFNLNRIRYLVTGLEHSTVYQMRVRLFDMEANSASLWSNTITFTTDVNQALADLEREMDDWLRYFRRRLEEILRQPFWIAQRTPTSLVVVSRPDDVFEGQMLAYSGTAIPLHNTGVNQVIYYLPVSSVLAANENRRGFSTAFPDLELLFAPSFMNDTHNQAMINMARVVEARGSELSDAFLKITINRNTLNEINNVPAITLSTAVRADIVGTNKSIRNIRTWDRTMSRRAEAIIESWLGDPVIRENIRQQLIAELSNEEMSDYLYHVVDRVLDEIIRETAGFISTGRKGILSTHRYAVRNFDAPMHVVATSPAENIAVNGYEFVNNNWQHRDTIEYHNGRVIIARAPGIFAFTGRKVVIPYIEITPHGGTIISIVARYGLEDLFGVNIDLQQNANRQMVVGSITRIAGVPRGADAFAWANANLNVQISSRNATALISRQEAIAVTMALYEHRINTTVAGIKVRDFRQTAGMNLDARYAQAVRAAFELGIVTDTGTDPAGAITIGEFLNMLSILSTRVRV